MFLVPVYLLFEKAGRVDLYLPAGLPALNGVVVQVSAAGAARAGLL